jgi:AraC-like DNA-binding protein
VKKEETIEGHFNEEQLHLSIDTRLGIHHSELNKGVCLCEIVNSEKENEKARVNVGKHFILYLFTNDEIRWTSSIDDKAMQMDVDQYGMLVFPVTEWNFEVELKPGKKIQILCISISELHVIFGNLELKDPQMLKDALKNYRQKSFLTLKSSTPAVRTIIHQLFSIKGGGISRMVFQKGKIMEFLAAFLDSGNNEIPEAECPYITDSLDWEKIRNAEKIIKMDLANPPTLKELAKKVGTNEFKLKIGFKHLYKNTIYGYLNDYRMDYAKEMLENKNVLIKDISEQVGYSSTSHFIASFRKKFGITPKQYLRG